jgi:hypothetical protein
VAAFYSRTRNHGGSEPTNAPGSGSLLGPDPGGGHEIPVAKLTFSYRSEAEECVGRFSIIREALQSTDAFTISNPAGEQPLLTGLIMRNSPVLFAC